MYLLIGKNTDPIIKWHKQVQNSIVFLALFICSIVDLEEYKLSKGGGVLQPLQTYQDLCATSNLSSYHHFFEKKNIIYMSVCAS